MSIDIDKLEALARAADEGPWDTDTGGEVHKAGRTIYAWPRLSGPVQTGANMEYGAAADPDTILALIARLREAEAERDELGRMLHERSVALQAAAEREQALAAHMGRIGRLWLPLSADIASLFDQQPQNMDDGSYLVDGQSAHDFVMALNDAPATSLARRDAEKQREILIEFVTWCDSLDAAEDMEAFMLSRQAEQADTAGEES